MKKTIVFLTLLNAISAFCQDGNLSGIYTEYKRTLWNNEDGAKYTINQKPFEPKMQFDFNNGNATTYDGSAKTEGTYFLKGDTLVVGRTLGKGQNARTLYTKYIILENKSDLVLREFKEGLDQGCFLKKYYFKKEKSLKQEYLTKNDYEIYTIVEEQPVFPGGPEEMKKFVNDEVSKSNLRGNEKVFLKLLISPEGKVLSADILNNPKVEYVEEAVKIARKFPDFTPAKQGGKPVYIFYNFPVKFNS